MEGSCTPIVQDPSTPQTTIRELAGALGPEHFQGASARSSAGMLEAPYNTRGTGDSAAIICSRSQGEGLVFSAGQPRRAEMKRGPVGAAAALDATSRITPHAIASAASTTASAVVKSCR